MYFSKTGVIGFVSYQRVSPNAHYSNMGKSKALQVLSNAPLYQECITVATALLLISLCDGECLLLQTQIDDETSLNRDLEDSN